MGTRHQSARFQIGSFLVDVSLDELSGDGKTKKIERRAMQVLEYLAANPAKVVSVEELLDTVWADVVVTPDSVYRTITALRRAFGDDPRTPQYIASVPRRGYRLVAPVTTLPPLVSATEHLTEHNPKGGPQHASIAVLPFADMSEKKNHEYFSDGLSEELIHLLSQVPTLRVPARTSSFHFKGKAEDISVIANRLRVAHVLEGSVRTSGDKIRVTVQLIRADTGYHVWSKTYDRNAEDIFKLQDEIAAAVVDALKVQLLAPWRSVRSHHLSNPAAYDEFLLGRQLFLRGHSDDFREGVKAYRRAIAHEPGYAAAFAGLALTEAYLADVLGDAAGRARALQAADKAVVLAPDLAEGYAARGTLRFVFHWDWAGAQNDLSRALSLEPTDSWAQRQSGKLQRSLGRMNGAIAAGRAATDSDPLSNFMWEGLGNTYAAAGLLPLAREAYSRALDLQTNSFYATDGLAVVELLEGRAAEARALIARIDVTRSFRLPGIAMSEHSLGHKTDSRRALNTAIERQAHTGAYDIATAFAWRGEHNEVFEWLERAYEQRERGLSEVQADPLLAGIRADPRYRELLRRMNLPGA
jgi:TolB-like protein